MKLEDSNIVSSMVTDFLTWNEMFDNYCCPKKQKINILEALVTFCNNNYCYLKCSTC